MRYAIICPGRGSYTESSLGTLTAALSKGGRAAELVQEADELRRSYNLTSLAELDGAERFSAARHLRPANVSALIFVATILDVEESRWAHADDELVGICGNSMGWYTALAAASALSFADGFSLVQEMAIMQESQRGGGQLLYPVVDENWQPDPERKRAVEDALASSHGKAFPSIDLGGLVVLAGSDTGITHLGRSLPPIAPGTDNTFGKHSYPLRLAQHGPYHSRLLSDVAFRAQSQLANLDWRRPAVTMVDGRGTRFTPAATHPAELANYTLGHQVTRPFDFTRSVRTLLREQAPDRLVLPGPGNTLGGICGQILCIEGWRGIHTRADFNAAQATDSPPVESMRR